MDDVEERKAALRRATRDARRSLTVEDRRIASATIVARLIALRELARAGTVALYAATDEEPDQSELAGALSARGVRLVWPRVVGDGLELAPADPGDLRPGFRGLLEPPGPAVDPRDVEALVVPGLAFDPHGARLGRGGGHYDRLLAAVGEDALAVGVAFSCQVVPAIPRGPHDLPVDVVVTDRSVHRRPVRTEDAPA
jgi:5-formyltetrahydrofolate cyclo-ligase